MDWLARTRLTSMFLIALLFALVSMSCETLSAQSSSSAPAGGPTTAPPASKPTVTSVKPPQAADRNKQLYKALQMATKRGTLSYLPDYIAGELGMNRASANGQHEWATVLDIDGARKIYLIDNANTAVAIIDANGQTMVYLIRSGVLKQAGLLKSGRFGSQSLQNIPLSKAADGFNVERDLWMEQLVAK
jgi:hypothetical protein